MLAIGNKKTIPTARLQGNLLSTCIRSKIFIFTHCLLNDDTEQYVLLFYQYSALSLFCSMSLFLRGTEKRKNETLT